jgi:hypothetical protein
VNWIAALASLTPLLVALGIGGRWFGKQIWAINRLLATQNAAIEWQNKHFEELKNFDGSVEESLDALGERVSDIERYLESQAPNFEKPFVLRWMHGKYREL